MVDEGLTDEERAALETLPREAAAPSSLERRVVAALRERRLIAPPRARLVALAAALSLAAGVALGLSAPRLLTTEAARGRSYLLLLRRAGDPAGEQARVAEYRQWAGRLRAEGRLADAHRLAREAVFLGTPSAPTEDPITGFFVIVAASRAEAEEIARGSPHLRHGGWIELREIDL